jgi:uncharacterized damage-inducible protein DinB
MSEVGRIWDLLQRAHEGDAWHGPSLRELLADVNAERAAARPLPGAHTIWELVDHIASWEDVVRRRLEGEHIEEIPTPASFPTPASLDAAAWRESVQRLESGHRRLRQTISALGDQALSATAPGRDYPTYVMLYGVLQHDLYHAGQIALLKKAQGLPTTA